MSYVQIVRRKWKQIAITTAVGATAAAAWALLAPAWFESTLTVVPRVDTNDASMLAAAGGALGGALDLASSLSGAGGDIERIAAVIKSRTVTDEAIKRFKLMDRYQEDYIELARKALWKHCDVQTDKKGNTVTLTCEDTDPRVAQRLTAFFGDFGNQVFGRVSAGSAREERKFLQKRVSDAKKDMDQSSRTLQIFQEQHKLIDLGEQARSVVSALASVRGEQMTKEIQLSYLQSFASGDEASALQLKRQIAILGNKLTSLEEVKKHADGQIQGDLFPAAMSVPALRFRLEQLYRDQKIQETVFLLLTQKLEMTMVNEARDTSTFQVLDDAIVPTFRARPHRLLILALGLLLSLVLGVGWVLWPHWRQEQQREAAPEEQPPLRAAA
jgi:capsule polysaccharide export protein KpsE/RkpR